MSCGVNTQLNCLVASFVMLWRQCQRTGHHFGLRMEKAQAMDTRTGRIGEVMDFTHGRACVHSRGGYTVAGGSHGVPVSASWMARMAVSPWARVVVR